MDIKCFLTEQANTFKNITNLCTVAGGYTKSAQAGGVTVGSAKGSKSKGSGKGISGTSTGGASSSVGPSISVKQEKA